jgi:ParB-like chromosome segregation protein Spo0J
MHSAEETASPYRLIKLSDIHSTRSPRADAAGLKFLEESASKIGVLQAPVVAPARKGGGYRLIAGSSRLAVLKRSGVKEAWCHVLNHVEDTPQTKLAFIVENLERTELPPAERDGMFAARRKLIEQIDPTQVPRAKQSAGGKKAGKGRSIGADKSSAPIRPSKTAEGKSEQRAIARKTKVADVVVDLYANDELKQSQVDELVKIKDHEKQAEVARAVVGKTVTETQAMVRAVREEDVLPTKELRPLFLSMETLRKSADRVQEDLRKCIQELEAVKTPLSGSAVSDLAMKLQMIESMSKRARSLLVR